MKKLYHRINSKSNKWFIDSMKKEMETFDDLLFEEHDKTKFRYVKTAKRTLETEKGTLTYKRKIYKILNALETEEKYISLLDMKMGIPKRTKLFPDFRKKIISQIGTQKRYRDILDMFPEANISKMTISRIYREIDLRTKEDYVSQKVVLEKRQRVFINIDDTFVRTIVGKTTMKQKIRVVSFNTGLINSNMKNRKKLENKKINFTVTSENSDPSDYIETIASIRKWGNIYFENFDWATLVVGGDGAAWIKSIAKTIGATYVLDCFHAIRYLKNGYLRGGKKFNPQNHKNYYKAKELFLIGDYSKLMKLLSETDYPKDFYRYFENNRNGVEAYSNDWNIGVSAESDVSRLVKSSLGYGSRLYSHKTFMNILCERAFKINNDIEL